LFVIPRIMPRHVFYSFHYEPDNWRVSQIRNIGKIEGNKAALDNRWEEVKEEGEAAVKRWIDAQLKGRSCTLVLIGSGTAKRKWIDYEIKESWRLKKGVVGIHIHKIKDRHQRASTKGANPFSHFTLGDDKKKFDQIVKTYDPPGADGKAVYGWIAQNITAIIDEAIEIRNSHS